MRLGITLLIRRFAATGLLKFNDPGSPPPPEGPPSVTTLPHRQGCGPASGRVPPLGARAFGRGAPRERGRPARMHSRLVPLSFPGMGHPATLAARTAWVRPKQSPGAVAGQAGSRSWARPCQCCAGGTPALPGGLHPMRLPHPRRFIVFCVYSCPFVVRRSPARKSFHPAGGFAAEFRYSLKANE